MKKLSKITESIWSDIQDRSAGDSVREEDKITTNEELKNKIKELYKEQGEGETLDVSSLTKFIKCDDFSDIFRGFYKVKQIIGLEDWDVSSVKDMKFMFSFCKNFNSDLSNWDVSNVKDMHYMFYKCRSFNSDLSNWDVSKVENMTGMFSECDSLKIKPSWYMKKLSKITESIWSDIQDRSSGDTVRKEDLITTNGELRKKILELYKEQGEGETLDVSSLTNRIKCDDFSDIFQGYTKVKHIIGLEDWDVSKVTNMFSMFWGCKNFNSDLSNWDVSSVEDMGLIFSGCKSLEQFPSWYINR